MIISMRLHATKEEVDAGARAYRRVRLQGPLHRWRRARGDRRGRDGRCHRLHRIARGHAPSGESRPHLGAVQVREQGVSPEKTEIKVAGATIGGDEFVVMAGPCSVESEQQILESAEIVAEHGAKLLRGGAFKPRTSPYDFQGLEEEGLKLLAKARELTGLASSPK